MTQPPPPPRPSRRAFFGALAAALLASACSVVSFVGPRVGRSAGAPAGAPEARGAGPITAVTFNVRRAEEVEAAIAHLRRDPTLRDADVVLLQEMDAAGAGAVARALGMHHVYYPSYVQNGRESGNAILSRFPIRADRALVLPHPNPIDQRRRRVVRAVLDAPDGPLLVYSVHLLPVIMSVRGRRAQARHVLEDAARFEGVAVIIGGDFNTYEPWSVRGVVDDYQILGFDWASRAAEETADYFFGSPRLDHVFVRGLIPVGAGAPRTSASDHRPLWVKLRRPTPGP